MRVSLPGRLTGGTPDLTGRTAGGVAVTLRAPRITDAGPWRRMRVADQDLIEPFWDHSELSWSQRHTARMWWRECASSWRRMRDGAALHTVVEVDGRLVGQCDAWIDGYHGRAELGLWVGSGFANRGVGAAAVRIMLAQLFENVGVQRVSAPVSPDNIAVTRMLQRLQFTREGLMRSYLETGAGRLDHVLWSLTAAEWPVGSARGGRP